MHSLACEQTPVCPLCRAPLISYTSESTRHTADSAEPEWHAVVAAARISAAQLKSGTEMPSRWRAACLRHRLAIGSILAAVYLTLLISLLMELA